MATILVIDDDDLFRATLVQALEVFGNVVAIAADGFEGAKFCRTSPPEFAFVDMIMPYGGLQTIRVLKSQFPGIRLVAMSGSDQRRLDYARDLGADDTLAKPFTMEQLRTVLSRIEGAGHEQLAAASSDGR